MLEMLVALSLLLAGLFRPAAPPGGEILVFGAASLAESLQTLGGAWKEKTGLRVAFSFGASSDLARQIQAGAPADVFFSADTAKMDALEKAGLVRREDRREFLSNVLVVVVPSCSKTAVSSARDLLTLSRIALADPEAVPAGIYAREWLTSEDIWESIRERVVPTLDVRAALAAVASESVAAGIVYRTDAATSGSVRIAYEVTKGPEILYSLAAVARSPRRDSAQEFVRFVASDDGLAEFRRRGFLARPRP